MTIQPLTPLIRAAIPLVFDESLSYVEFLAAVTAKVNELVTATNTFLNQDINDMVVTQLNAWLADGTLASLIDADILTDIDAMKGTGWTTENLVDNATAIAALDTRIDGLLFRVSDYGATGDGATDDTAAFQAAIDAASAAGGGTVWVQVPAVDYRIVGTITLKMNVSLVGEALYNMEEINQSILLSHEPTVAGTDLFQTDAIQPLLGYISGIRVQNIMCKGNANSQYAFDLTGAANLVMRDVYILSFETGLYLEYLINCRFEKVDVNACSVSPFEMQAPVSTTITFSSCYFHNSPIAGLIGDKAVYQAMFTDATIFESCEDGLDIHTDNIVNFSGCYVENIPSIDAANDAFKLGITGTPVGAYSFGCAVFTGCEIKGKAGTAAAGSTVFNVGKQASLVVNGGRVANFTTTLKNTVDARVMNFNGLFEQQINNGVTTTDALVLDANILGVRTKTIPRQTLANKTYYVATTGNDANDGLTAGTPFLTIAKAISMIPQIVNHTVTINVAAGVYAAAVVLDGFVGKGIINILGGVDLSDAANFIVTSFSANAVKCEFSFQGFTASTTTATAFSITNSTRATIRYCQSVAAGTTIGFLASWAMVTFRQCQASNKGIAAMYIQNSSTVLSKDWTAGSGNAVGISSLAASTVGKDGTQPQGTTAEAATTGGVIR